MIGALSVSVSANTIEEDYSFWNNLNDLFSSLGQQANCEIYPQSGNDGTFSSSRTLSCTNYEGTSTNDCLINVFHANYVGTNPASECGNYDVEGEVNNCLEYIVTTGSRSVTPLGSNSIYEIYNCPPGSLSGGANDIADCACDFAATDSSCDSSDTCGTDKPKCMEISGDDICVTTGQYFNACPNGLDGSSQECECDSSYSDSSWKNQRCPSTRPYCIDNSVSGTSYDACSTSPSGSGVQTCSAQGGIVCGGGESCSTGFVNAADTSTCCLGTCESVSTTCAEPLEQGLRDFLLGGDCANSFTRQEFQTINDATLKTAICESSRNCNPYQNSGSWTVSCVQPSTIGIIIPSDILEGLLSVILGWDTPGLCLAEPVYDGVGFCIPQVNDFLSPITGIDDCQTNSIILIIGGILGMFAISRLIK